MRVLIVEDETLIAMELERIVTDAGHSAVGPVSTVEQALAHAPRVEAALVDLGLADGLSGAALARRLIDRYGTKVIFVTGTPREVGHGLDGAVDVVGKPFSDERILQSLAKADTKSKTALNVAADW
ncbi:response regulator [Rhizobium sp. BE258]|jgi:DNA-binding response OmpR family regulator|uniref:response regulator n=1 Tax=Rhizobium sp. BE258 TaxID=2817722 RepID=UPI000DDBF52B|nr:response regulator [Rhizobium sp. BE258]MDR7145107.1 DNA-binding response OmpR family regulator [Rhizobium sp. BE258]